MNLKAPPPTPTARPTGGGSSHILKRIPVGAEATNVLVGSVDFLEKPIMAFVRLLNSCEIGDMMEVALPIRFIILLIGPVDTKLDYYEIGRSIATLMSDQTFHDQAYMFRSREDLLNAIHEFLDNSIVLPPGELDRKTLLPIMDLARQKRLRKKRKKEIEMSFVGEASHILCSITFDNFWVFTKCWWNDHLGQFDLV